MFGIVATRRREKGAGKGMFDKIRILDETKIPIVKSNLKQARIQWKKFVHAFFHTQVQMNTETISR